MNDIVSIANGQAVTTTPAIALGTQLEHKSVIQLVRNYLTDLEEFGRVTFEMAPFETAGGTQRREIALLNEQQATLLLTYMRNSDIVRTFKKRLVKAFWELAKALNPDPAADSKLTGELALLECFTRMLRPAPSSQLAMLQHIGRNNGLDTTFLPAYAIDAPSNDNTGSSMPTKPITDLLADHGINYSAKAYNQLLHDAGMLEARTRRTSDPKYPDGKPFWAVTIKGLQYGKNITNPASPRETQPHWYVERFAEMHAIVLGHLRGAA